MKECKQVNPLLRIFLMVPEFSMFQCISVPIRGKEKIT
ncbi:hypothetical protein JCM19236_1001 [Vibrio sp. JCM 19236]|nr:hypothetical protein JCM19236_1001 [Vibrio sp. JCM 19236]